MHEVVTISVSQRANHLTTQFFNIQEGYLQLSKEQQVNDSKIFLNSVVDKVSKQFHMHHVPYFGMPVQVMVH